MAALLIIVLYEIAAAIGHRWCKPTIDGPVASLCLTCVNAVVTRGTRGQERLACAYGGGLRPVEFTVCECTALCGTRSATKLVAIQGFVREAREVYEEVAIK